MSVVSTDAQAVHAAGVARLLDSYRAIEPTATVRLAKPTSNLFRARPRNTGKGLDTSGLTNVIAVDPHASTADVAGMCTYEDLVAATLPYGLAPLVVPQLKTITLGGAVTGLGIESTSFRNGLPHESVIEMDILTGAGEIVTASRTSHSELFHSFPNSYGTLGYSTRLRIELEPVTPFVELRHLRFHRLADLVATMDRIIETGGLDGVKIDYLDGVVFSAEESYLCVGIKTTTPGPVSDYTGQQIYYRSIQHADGQKHDRLTIHDYLWRWDTDWFWCSRAFGAQNPRIRRFWPRRYRRSSFYWKLIGYDQRFNIADRIEIRNGRPPRERVVQDIEVPLERCAEFLTWFLQNIPIEPIWLCPLRLRDDTSWPLYPIRPHHTYVNVGFWSSVPVGPEPGHTNKLIERKVSELEGHKSLYSDAFYSPEEFDHLYGGETYKTVKKAYDPDSRLLDLYSKAVQRR
ncbi:FAD linked oxidase domain-containing protein [Mycolicibacterium mageritense DSM 44476 = CIP 104973]|uniref:Delta(24)-sterol reductase n=1 Tax=Mycolicibacterium mageritense TaxID=53462 RepID=A0ABM7HT85_MYCME|nr:FAD-binding oxidoreductase [Mycolicibacterium mageritense]MBN3456171.1 FAD-binding oxidoreductase [Mycobacterium sp. DSM 3803]MCC9182907.1 FAD-binding oxidoreductase [Mycolicibacterium mageritense]CDO22206.1 FAD linked oxidase domain-containing protein [Mycolicibacterium mageritense DSM 44476 = CIP 104973]BBX33781.1 FAD-linked oxidase [Mycolicibacterium mageritense]GJJ20005.1 FAD-linked oxidase [Mycolicibacterium mageritense]